jgi:hypothetical protein
MGWKDPVRIQIDLDIKKGSSLLNFTYILHPPRDRYRLYIEKILV